MGEGRRALRLCPGRAGVHLIALACVVWSGAPVHGQQPLDVARGRPAGAPANQVESDPLRVESDPIKCWWKTDKNAVRVGEPLDVALTCGVIETDAIRVTVDPARLDAAALDMRPFEVLGGTRHGDISAPPWRYFQYSYTLRLLGSEFFGRDVDVPALPLTYRVESTAAEAGQARDQLYLLPALPLRVVSLVPVTATDIRDAPPETFADIEARSRRATREFAAAALLFAFAAVVAGVAVVRATRRARGSQPASAALLPAGAVFHACDREARRVRSEAAAGWTPDLIGRALTAFRIAGAMALGRPVAQTLVEKRERPSEGQLTVEKGRWRPQRVLISASTTPAVITAGLANGDEMDPRLREALEDIGVSLRVFGAAHFSRSGTRDSAAFDAATLDSALDRGLRGLDRLRSATRWPARAAEAVARTVAAFREARWAR